jgi:hypothetical protein
MPELVLNGEMINLFTNPDGYQQIIAAYNAHKNKRHEYYMRHREEILAKRKQRYAEANPEPKRRRKPSIENNE